LDRLRHPRLWEAAPDRRHRHPAAAGRVFMPLHRGVGAGGRLGRRPGPQPALVGARPLGGPGDGADLHHQRFPLGVVGQRPLPVPAAAPTGRYHRGVRPVVPGGPGERQPLSPLLPAPGEGLAVPPGCSRRSAPGPLDRLRLLSSRAGGCAHGRQPQDQGGGGPGQHQAGGEMEEGDGPDHPEPLRRTDPEGPGGAAHHLAGNLGALLIRADPGPGG
jgi:hypothetical protein